MRAAEGPRLHGRAPDASHGTCECTCGLNEDALPVDDGVAQSMVHTSYQLTQLTQFTALFARRLGQWAGTCRVTAL